MTFFQRLASLLAAFGLTLILPPFSSEAFQADDDLPPADFSVETRGPVHEAFAQPNDGKLEMGAPVPKEPPPMIPERPPEQTIDNPNMEWIPGYWAWDADRNDFVWVTGTLRNPPPGRRWIPGHWANTNAGWNWVPGFWAPENQPELQYTPEPPAPLEDGPALPAPNADSSYVPGYWYYNSPDQRFAWRPGYWAPFRTGRIWTSPQYMWTPNGYVFVPGYWDYPLDDRGLLFAPAYFPTPLWNNAGWFYQPNYVVSLNLFFGSGFYRPGWNSFYFGNYYGGNYAGLGYRPWWGGPRNSVYDYYRWHNRNNPQWAHQHQQLHNDRVAGRAPLPPSTLAQQRTQLKVNNGANATVAAVTPLRSFTPKTGALVPNTRTAAQNLQIQQTRDLTKLRATAETGTGKTAGVRTGANSAGISTAGPVQTNSLKLPPNPPHVRPLGTPAPSLSDNHFRAGNGSVQTPYTNPSSNQLPNPGKTAPGAGSGPAGAAKLPYGNPYAAPNGSGVGTPPKQFGSNTPQSPNPISPKGPSGLQPATQFPRNFEQNPTNGLRTTPPVPPAPRTAPTPPTGNLPRLANPTPVAGPRPSAQGPTQMPNMLPANPAPRIAPAPAPAMQNIPRAAPPPSNSAPRMAAPAPQMQAPRPSFSPSPQMAGPRMAPPSAPRGISGPSMGGGSRGPSMGGGGGRGGGGKH